MLVNKISCMPGQPLYLSLPKTNERTFCAPESSVQVAAWWQQPLFKLYRWALF